MRKSKSCDDLRLKKNHEKNLNRIFFFQHFRKCGEAKIEYPKGSNGEQVQKCKLFVLLFYDTPFNNWIFSMVALIAQRSKYDF